MLLLQEPITKPLSFKEKQLIKPMVRGLLNHKSRTNSISLKEIILGFAHSKWSKYKVTSDNIKRIIFHIRVNNLVWGVCSDDKGFFVANTKKEFRDHIRATKTKLVHIQTVLDSLEEQYIDAYEETPYE